MNHLTLIYFFVSLFITFVLLKQKRIIKLTSQPCPDLNIEAGNKQPQDISTMQALCYLNSKVKLTLKFKVRLNTQIQF